MPKLNKQEEKTLPTPNKHVYILLKQSVMAACVAYMRQTGCTLEEAVKVLRNISFRR